MMSWFQPDLSKATEEDANYRSLEQPMVSAREFSRESDE